MNNQSYDFNKMPIGAVEKKLREYELQLLKQQQIRNRAQIDSIKRNISELKAKECLGYKEVISAFSKNTLVGENYGNIASATNIFRQAIRKILGDHDENVKVASILMNNGWATLEFIYNNILKDNYHKSEEEVINYIENFYSENGYHNFFRIFDLVINGFKELQMDEGYRLQLIRIRNIVGQDFKDYGLFISTLFSIAEYVCDFQFGLLTKNDYINKRSIKINRRKFADKNGKLTAIDIMSLFSVLKNWWGKANFKVGLNKTEFNRNTIEHGRYDPRRLKKTDFIKIIVFIFNVMMSPELTHD